MAEILIGDDQLILGLPSVVREMEISVRAFFIYLNLLVWGA
tara:strand:- start:9 stop:131 length:123 start_codon:yes stop_codon:yes gene_type:complete